MSQATPARLTPFLRHEAIQKLVKDLGSRINADYEPVLGNSELVFVVTLKGALFFAADLLREITLPARMDFVRVASYGSGTKSSGSVIMTKDTESPLAGNHVIILDEIVDTGHTLAFLLERFREAGPKSLKVCALLSKPSRREVNVPVDYVGRDVEDKFLVGYGLDFDERYRNLKDIYTLGH